jgi:hypothetical protein
VPELWRGVDKAAATRQYLRGTHWAAGDGGGELGAPHGEGSSPDALVEPAGDVGGRGDGRCRVCFGSGGRMAMSPADPPRHLTQWWLGV